MQQIVNSFTATRLLAFEGIVKVGGKLCKLKHDYFTANKIQIVSNEAQCEAQTAQ